MMSRIMRRKEFYEEPATKYLVLMLTSFFLYKIHKLPGVFTSEFIIGLVFRLTSSREDSNS